MELSKDFVGHNMATLIFIKLKIYHFHVIVILGSMSLFSTPPDKGAVNTKRRKK
jgi:hypothetical protein